MAVALAMPACGAHLHRERDAEGSQQAQAELKAARLTEGFAPELQQASAMLEQELALGRTWAQTGRDRDLLDVLSATAIDENDPETEILMHPRCRGRFKADGWTTLCSKLSRRIAELGGLTLPFASVVAAASESPASGRPRKEPSRPAGPDPILGLLAELRGQGRAWSGPQSDTSRLAKAGTDLVVGARAMGLSETAVPQPRCPAAPPAPGVQLDPAIVAALKRVHGLCGDRRRNLGALFKAGCAGVAECNGGRLGATSAAAATVHDALAAHDLELSRRLDAYAAARRPCEATGPSGHVLAASTTGSSGQVTPMPAGPAGPATCDPAQVQRAFAALDEIPTHPALTSHDYTALAREGRVIQLREQLAALGALIQARSGGGPARAPTAAMQVSPALARALHGTVAGIQRVEAVVDAFEVAVLSLIRETVRVEANAIASAIGHAERRRRIDLARITAQLDEYTLLVAAYADLQRLERSGCALKPFLEAQQQQGCRDETTRMLLAYSNAWTLGRAAQQQADVLDLGVRHEASIDRSRAAMAVREVYLVAGVAELAKFTRGGFQPEALAQIIVSAVGFGIVAGGVY